MLYLFTCFSHVMCLLILILKLLHSKDINVLIMVENITIFSQNCRGGLSVATKRRDLFQYVRGKKYNIVCLQDTHINKNLESFIKAEWGYEAYFSSYTTNSRGVMILN